MTAQHEPVETDELALFPLRTVLFPGGVLPLRIFEPRYIDMIGNCMRNE
ncbi:MAG: LON peptidase substrate-binding domain-containing protein, partial [Pseudomonadota bacterium]